MSNLVGHEQQRAALSELAASERLPSSLLFAGVEGIGKRLVAQELAAQLLCAERPCGPKGGCGKCKPCILLRAGNHPDLLQLSFGEDGASVEDLRAALDRLSLKAFMGGRKVAILDNADQISAIGANTLLKSLEEPRPETFYVLVAANSSRLPQTVLSRCQRWFFDRLPPDAVRAILTSQGQAASSEAAAILADGSLRGLEGIRERADALSDVRAVVDAAFLGDDRIIGRAAQEWGANKDSLKETITFLRTSIRQKLLDHAQDTEASAVWATALQNAIDAEYLALERHVNPTLVLLEVLQSCNRSLSQAYQELPGSSPTLAERLRLA